MKITKRQLNRIIAEETQKLNEAPAYRMKEYERKKNQTLQQLMNSIRSQITFIEGQLLMGSFDYEDMFDWDFGHIAGLADTIDAAREKAAEEGVPFVEPDTSRIAEYQHRGKPAVVSRWSMNESTSKPNKMKITKRQLQRIIREEKARLNENPGAMPSADERQHGYYDAIADLVFGEIAAAGLPAEAELPIIIAALEGLARDLQSGNY